MENVQNIKFRTPWSRRSRVLFWILGIGFGICFLVCVVWSVLISTRILALKQSIDEAQRAIATYDLSSAQLALDDAVAHTQDVEHALSWFSVFSWIPYVGDTYAAYMQAIHVAGEGFALGSQALAVASSVTDAIDRAHVGTSFTFLEDPRPYSDFSEDERRAALNAFAQSALSLRSLRVALALAQQDIERIHAEDLRIPQAISAMTRAQEELPKLVTALDILTPFASVARSLGGLNEETQFLILYLNNSELRPGGGFIGAYSLMNVREGAIANFSTEDSYFPDHFVEGSTSYHVYPPTPIAEQLGITNWFFRDAAWSPSFAQTAQDARQLLRQELAYGNQPIPDAHHVLGITPDFIEKVLAFVGPVTANGTTYTSENVYDLLEYEVELGFVNSGTAYEDRKLALKIVSETMIDRLLSMSPSSWISFFDLFDDELQKKHVALFSTDVETQAALADASWTGTVEPASVDDAFMLVDANLAALKTDPVVRRLIAYSIAPASSGGYRATCSITYTHDGTRDWKITRYRTYARLFVPEGAALVESAGTVGETIIAHDLGMTSFATFLEVEPGESKTIRFTYDLPEATVHAIERGVYTLGAFKQMGAGDNLLTLDLDFGTNLVAADPGEDQENYGNTHYEYSTTLSSDALFRVTL